ncbi:hypothetical protein GUJ93_ZPchr0005g14786 [Zizania palustris]|uniref:Uncharacterized protein n=1 Tax=Zizania palustris TaxID=103762 RepID=A0A8J5SHF1_ZIZPA|nr:hypothetical protein GUJ93_ZPchr0005g14786 [Zizania palustris]
MCVRVVVCGLLSWYREVLFDLCKLGEGFTHEIHMGGDVILGEVVVDAPRKKQEGFPKLVVMVSLRLLVAAELRMMK